MKTTKKKLFNLRGFIIITATVAGLGLPITGLAIHLVQMKPLVSFSRHAWMSVHTLLGVLFMASTVWHAVLNRRILLNHIRGRAAGPGIGRETISAIILIAMVMFVAVGHALH